MGEVQEVLLRANNLILTAYAVHIGLLCSVFNSSSSSSDAWVLKGGNESGNAVEPGDKMAQELRDHPRPPFTGPPWGQNLFRDCG